MDTNTKIKFANIVSSEEAINIITTCVKKNLSDPSSHQKSILLRGGPGCGKSSIVRDIAAELGIGFVDIRLAQMERCDLCGLPSVENGVTKWNVPEFWPRDPKSKGIIFFDEITSAPSDCQVASYAVILDRKIPNSDYKIPDGWTIVAAGNRSNDRAVVKSMSSALANRFMHFELEANPEDWGNWAIKHDIHPSVTGFIRYRPVNLFNMDQQNLECGWPSPRSWESVSDMIPLFGDNEDTFRKIVYGLIGNQVGVEFMEFHRLQKNFDDVLEILTNPNKEFEIPSKSDEKYAFVSAAAYMLWTGHSEEDTAKRISGLYRILMKLTADFAVLLMKSATLGNSKINKMQAISQIIKHPDYKKFQEKFGDKWNKSYSL